MEKVLVICGPTASGKTALSVACAKKLGSAVVSADSQLVYRGLNIGTAKPTEEEMQGVPHYMIDVIDPDNGFSVADYRAMAIPVLDELASSGVVPVICGGTGFYINSLLFDFGYANAPADEKIRAKYEEIAEKKGRDYLYAILCRADPDSAEKIGKNDVKRMIRALEIFEVTGKRKSEQDDGKRAMFDYTAVEIDYPREELYSRIDERVDSMFDSGLVDEVSGLLSRGIDETKQCMSAIGYRETAEGLRSGDDMDAIKERVKRDTRRYAKRQLTFFKKLPGLHLIPPRYATPENVLSLLA